MADMLNELVVLNEIADIMRSLGTGEQRRILAWLEDYFDIYEFDEEDDDEAFGEATDVAPVAAAAEEPAPTPDTFERFFEQVAPKTAIQKIVTAAYWLDSHEGAASWKSFEVNKLLKSIDVKVSSVSGTLGLETKKDDSMVVVLDRSSDSMQGRKTFRLSESGLAFVEARL